MSQTDMLAFQHELEENDVLARELEALELAEAILGFAASPSTVAASGSSGGGSFFHSRSGIAALAGLLLIAGAAVFVFSNGKPKSTPAIPEFGPKIQVPAEHLEPLRVLDIPAFQMPDQHVAEVAPNQASAPKAGDILPALKKVPTPSERIPTHDSGVQPSSNANLVADAGERVPVENVSKKPGKLEIFTVEAVIDEEIPQYANVSVTATNTITLKPGFSTSQGASFKASINSTPFSAKLMAE